MSRGGVSHCSANESCLRGVFHISYIESDGQSAIKSCVKIKIEFHFSDIESDGDDDEA
jgi:hypothetical protein